MKRYYAVCVVIGLIITAITINYRNEPTRFYGIADTKETIVNATEGVEIQKIYVVQGQSVSAGDTLAVLENSELRIRINEIVHTLNEYQAQKKYQTSFSQAEKLKYEAEQAERANEIMAEIRELEAQYELNKKLVKELRSIKPVETEENDSTNPILTQIKGLRRLLESARNPAQTQIDFFSKELATTDDPIQAQVQRYAMELELLQEQQRQLVKKAPISAIIGMVKFKEGERVAPFDTILTLHAAAPSYIKGYIHENVYSHVAVGDSVMVRAAADSRNYIDGIVTGVGSRIIDFPERLRKMPDFIIWGREIIIKIPDDNNFLLGEKVLISVHDKKKTVLGGIAGSIFRPIAANVEAKGSSSSVTKLHSEPESGEARVSVGMLDIVVDPGLTVSPVEASGLLYLPDIKLYLLISDDTDRKEPVLFLMDDNGRVRSRAMVRGLDNINDMEGIAQDEQGTIYLMASQSFNKKGKQSAARKLLVRVSREGTSFVMNGSVELFDILLAAALEQGKSEWADFITTASRTRLIDIEGIACIGDTVLLGFKDPKINNSAVVMAIAAPDELFANNGLSSSNISIWRKIPVFDSVSGTVCGISDILFHDGILYGTSTGVSTQGGFDEDIGIVWFYSPENGAFTILHRFCGLKPEGVALNGNSGELCVAFDNGSKNMSQIMKIKVTH